MKRQPEKSYREKLQAATAGRIPRTRRVRDPLPNITSMGEDGVDHINIGSGAATQLGRDLSHNARFPLTHSVFGRFDSMQAFWEYIRSEERDDRLRNLYGERLYRMAKRLHPAKVQNFRAIIMDANYQKIVQHPALAKALAESDKPFDCWYRYNRDNGIQARPGYAHWLIWGFEEIRKALKEEREPNFTELMESRRLGLYGGVVVTAKVIAPAVVKAEEAAAEALPPIFNPEVQEPIEIPEETAVHHIEEPGETVDQQPCDCAACPTAGEGCNEA